MLPCARPCACWLHAGYENPTPLHGTVQGPRPGASDEIAEPGALLRAAVDEQPDDATGAADEAMREGDGEEEEEEEAEEELSGSSRCANLGTRECAEAGEGRRVAAAGVLQHDMQCGAVSAAWASHITPGWASRLSGILAVLM